MIIGIAGRKNSGKDLVGLITQWLTQPDEHKCWDNKILDFLQYKNKRIGFNWEVKKFADKLKDIVCLLIGCTREQLEDANFKETPLGAEWSKMVPFPPPSRGFRIEDMTPRLLLQLIGTECGRNIIHTNIWVNATMSSYKPYYKNGMRITGPFEANWIITDVRFPNEVKAIKDRGGLVFKLDRKDLIVTDTHTSETALDNYKDFDNIIHNDGTIEELVEHVQAVLNEHKLIKTI